MTEVPPVPQALDFGPVSVDSNRLGPELGALAGVLILLLAFGWASKRI